MAAEKTIAFVMRDGVCSLEEITRPEPRFGAAGRPLYLARVRAHVGLREVADALDHAAAYVSGAEQGRLNPDAALLAYYGERFGVDVAAVRAAFAEAEESHAE